MAQGSTVNLLNTTRIRPTITKTGGNGTVDSADIDAWRSGNVVTMKLWVVLGAKPAVGDDIYRGTLSNAPLPKAGTATGVGYYASACCIISIGSNGAVTVRLMTNSSYWVSTEPLGISLTYVTG